MHILSHPIIGLAPQLLEPAADLPPHGVGLPSYGEKDLFVEHLKLVGEMEVCAEGLQLEVGIVDPVQPVVTGERQRDVVEKPQGSVRQPPAQPRIPLTFFKLFEKDAAERKGIPIEGRARHRAGPARKTALPKLSKRELLARLSELATRPESLGISSCSTRSPSA